MIPRLKERMFFFWDSFLQSPFYFVLHSLTHPCCVGQLLQYHFTKYLICQHYIQFGWFGLLTSGFEVGAKKCGVIPMYSKCKTQKGSKMIKFLHLDKCYILQKLSDPIRCKAEKGFSAESSPMNKRSFELWGKVFIHIDWPLIVQYLYTGCPKKCINRMLLRHSAQARLPVVGTTWA